MLAVACLFGGMAVQRSIDNHRQAKPGLRNIPIDTLLLKQRQLLSPSAMRKQERALRAKTLANQKVAK